MHTRHQIHFENSKHMAALAAQSVDLVVTSPPYPMIEMWDAMFAGHNPDIRKAQSRRNGLEVFELMHRELDQVWQEVIRVLKPGAIVCINIGDAVRTINENFMLYPNHSRILNYFLQAGFTNLPAILWRKPTNAPNKFMGSGMLPPGAYVTLEHEYILVLRNGCKREFATAAARQNRRESAFFWEERNLWYSDVWMALVGATQRLVKDPGRLRSGAFPFEVPYRLINMFSVKGDMVLDPFMGTGTTMWAAMAAGRNSTGFEVEPGFQEVIGPQAQGLVEFSNAIIQDRLYNHIEFVQDRFKAKGGFKYTNKHYKFPVMTNQEKELLLNPLEGLEAIGDNRFDVTYLPGPQQTFEDNWQELSLGLADCASPPRRPAATASQRAVQLKLL
ncbi:MAG: site-specific DNA-methyltransferase [Desulfobacterales bacterium]|nr:MAG: site-specific DNA-methyltransferase [Desulfobacterales bacterium]